MRADPAPRLLVSAGLREGGDPVAPLRPWLLEIDGATGEVLRRLRLPFDAALASGPDADDEATRPWLLPDGVWIQPTHTRVFRVCLDRWEVTGEWTHPRMGGVHSAAPRPGGGLVLSCAASDAVLEIDDGGGLIAEHRLREGGRAGLGDGDLRVLHHDALKPHSHHPNCAFVHRGAVWATCFETRECRTVDGRRRIALDGIPHDGAPQEGALWFTYVDGRIEARDPGTGARIEGVDLRALSGTPELLGWCRGIAVRGRRAWVGMTQLRSTTHREVLRVLLKGRRGRKRPSRVVEVDLDGPRIVRELPVGNAAGATIYGVGVRP